MAIGQGNNIEKDLGKRVSLPHTRVRVPDKQTCKKKLISKMPGAEWVAFANHNGGTGKTTPRLRSACYLAKDGNKVLVVDLISQHKQADDKLWESEERFHSLVETTPDLVWQIDKGNKYTYASPRIADILGYEPQEVIGKTPFDLMPPEEARRVATELQLIMDSHKHFDKVENINLHKDGRLVVLESSGGPIFYVDGQFRGYQGIDHDITGRKKAEKRIYTSEAQYRRLFEAAQDGILILDADKGKIIDVNPFIINRLGYTKDELLGKKLWEIGPFKNIEAAKAAFKELIGKDYVRYEHLPLEKKDGQLVQVEFISNSYFVDQVKVIQCNIRDITERKQMEESLKESEERYRTTLDIMDESYYELDLAGNFTFVNDSVCRLLGYSEEELIGMNYRVFTAKEDINTMYNAFNKVYRTGEPQQRNIYHGVVSKDGELGFRETSAFPIRNKKGEIIGFRGISIDITERKQMEEALRESEEHYRSLVELSPDAIIVASQGKYVFANSAGMNLLGVLSPDQILGKPVMDFIHPDYHEIVAERLGKAIERGITPPTLEERFRRIDGTEIDVEVRAAPLVYQCKPAMQVVVRDISERKQMEKAQHELERMKTEFISNISHELRTPLQSIVGFTKLMLHGKVPDPETQKEFLTIMDNQSEQLCSLIEDLLDIERIESDRFEIKKSRLSISDVIYDAVHGFHSLAGQKSIAITVDIPTALPEIEGDEERLRQVIVNLLSNAIKFSNNDGRITVKAEVKDNEVLVQVTDYGIGISEEAMKHLFERFYQGDGSMTRNVSGSGLGLYISKQIIEAHGGRIRVESKLDKGTTVFFAIPKASEKKRKKLGQILVEHGLITEQQLDGTLRVQESQK